MSEIIIYVPADGGHVSVRLEKPVKFYRADRAGYLTDIERLKINNEARGWLYG